MALPEKLLVVNIVDVVTGQDKKTRNGAIGGEETAAHLTPSVGGRWWPAFAVNGNTTLCSNRQRKQDHAAESGSKPNVDALS